MLFRSVENMTGPHPDRAGHLIPRYQRTWTQSNLERESRTLFDVIVGRQRFRMGCLPANATTSTNTEDGLSLPLVVNAGEPSTLTVVRGKVFDEDRTWDEWFTPILKGEVTSAH